MPQLNNRQKLARQCLRKIWQIFDAGGHSMGRSTESMLLEAAMRMLGDDSTFSTLADNDFMAFRRLIDDELWRIGEQERRTEDKRRGFRPQKKCSKIHRT